MNFKDFIIFYEINYNFIYFLMHFIEFFSLIYFLFKNFLFNVLSNIK